MTAVVSKLGPGSLSIGAVGSPVDFSCQVVNCQVTWDNSKDDDITVLCGDVVAGAKTYTAQLTGNLLQDQVDPDGIVRYSWDNKGTVVPFTFVPNTADGVEVTGEVTLDPIAVGSDTAGANMASDFTWDCVGEPVLGDVVIPFAEDEDAVSTGVEVKGAEAMQSSLKAAAKKVQDMEAVNREVASIVAAAANPPARTGRLAGSIRPSSTRTEAVITVDQPYAGVIENGWPKHNIAATNFVKVAFANTENATTAAYEKAMQGVLDDVKGA